MSTSGGYLDIPRTTSSVSLPTLGAAACSGAAIDDKVEATESDVCLLDKPNWRGFPPFVYFYLPPLRIFT